MHERIKKEVFFLRIAVLGCGQISPLHLESWQKIPGAEVVCVVDIDKEKALARQREYGIAEISTDYNEIIARKDIDIIDVCLPTYLHKDAVVKAAKAGKDIFCEKPMARSLEDAKEMLDVANECKVKLQLGFVRRFSNDWLKMKELVESGILGEKVVWRSCSANHGAPTEWFFDKKLGGGPFLDGAVHNYDFAHIMFGKVKKIDADLFRLGNKGDAFDTGTLMIEYENGNILQMNWSWALPWLSHGAWLEDYIGSEGALMYGCHGDFIYDKEKEGVITFIGKDGRKEYFTYSLNDMFYDEIKAFYDAVKENKEPLVGGKEGIEALEVALKVLGDI